MSKPFLTQAAEEVIALKLKAVDEWIESVVEPLADIGNPEKMIGKPYAMWSPEDLQTLYAIYGKALDKFIFQKELKYIQELEKTAI